MNQVNTGKYFDERLNQDKRGVFFNQASPICFKNCITLAEKDFTENEKNCVIDCYSKMIYAFENTQKMA